MPARRSSVLFVGALACVLAAGAVAGHARSRAAGLDLAQLEDVDFISVCAFSHRRPDDPIVHPGHPGLSHDHSFFGNVATDASSTAESLRSQPTVCDRSEDTAAYWAPTLLENDKVVEPIDATVYYRRRTVAPVRAFPIGFQMIGGNANATRPQSTRLVWWDCGTKSRVAPSTRVPTCPPGGSTTLRLNVRFPDCWDGKRLDSPDHKAHAAYSARGACPAGHRVALPSITLVVQYPIRGSSGVQLASGGQLSGHADFVNAWQQAGLRRLVAYCLNALRACGHSPA